MKSFVWGLALPLFLLSVGCKPATPTTASSSGAASADAHADHDHAHEELGPHGGHMLHLEPTGSHAEWTHDDDSQLITVYLDEFDGSKLASAKFTAKIGDAVEEFPLTASDNGWTVTSPELMTHINMKDAAEVNLVIVDDAGVHTAKVEAHDHHH